MGGHSGKHTFCISLALDDPGVEIGIGRAFKITTSLSLAHELFLVTPHIAVVL